MYQIHAQVRVHVHKYQLYTDIDTHIGVKATSVYKYRIHTGAGYIVMLGLHVWRYQIHTGSTT